MRLSQDTTNRYARAAGHAPAALHNNLLPLSPSCIIAFPLTGFGGRPVLFMFVCVCVCACVWVCVCVGVRMCVCMDWLLTFMFWWHIFSQLIHRFVFVRYHRAICPCYIKLLLGRLITSLLLAMLLLFVLLLYRIS